MDKNIANKEIAAKIRQLRVVKGWSREQMADNLDMSVSNYGNIERGETDIGFSRLSAIADVFDLSVGELLGLDEKHIINFGNSESACSIDGIYIGKTNLQSSIEKLVLLLKERDKEIENLKVQISQLREIIALLKEGKQG